VEADSELFLWVAACSAMTKEYTESRHDLAICFVYIAHLPFTALITIFVPVGATEH
jgi:hypothetical protein